jgi:phosphomannomutase
LSQLFERLPRWYGRADLIDDFPQQISQNILNYFSPVDATITWLDFVAKRITFHDATETIIGEWAYDEPVGEEFLAKKQKLESVFSQDRGFNVLVQINTLGRIRCFLRNGDIAHVRPSGNAPRLRIYAQARSQMRADAIVRMGVAESDGLLRELQQLIEGMVVP